MNALSARMPPSEHAHPPMPASSSTMKRIGRIVAVTGAHAIILLDASLTGLQEDVDKSPEIGTLLKVDTAVSISLALVSALSSPMPSHSRSDQELRIVEVEFIGELPKDEHGQTRNFRRGISCYPSLGDIVCRADRAELSKAYACDSETSIRVGHIQQDPTIPAMIKIDEMLGKHFAVLGTTGTGKSCTVALILRRILEKNPQAHILLLDVHREYASSFKGISEVITPENMSLPFWLLNFDECVEILVGQHASRELDIEILRDMIPLAKARYMANQRRDKIPNPRTVLENSNIGVDTPIPYRTSDLIGIIEEHIGKLELRGELSPYKRLKAKIESISRDPRYAFMFGSLTVQDNMAQVLSRIFRIPVNGKPIAILELGGLPSEIINVVVSVLARLAFDFGVWSAGQIPITFVCEEAHRYVPIDKTLGFEPTKRSISRIAKEGRKYGVSLCIVTQRPAELDPTILSQCNTIFSMRLTNERDQDILRAGISDAAASLMEFMSTMGTGEAVTFGEGVALPTRIKFDMLPPDAAPKSNTASFTKNWAKDIPDANFLHEIVSRWRAQTYNPDSPHQGPDIYAAAPAQAPNDGALAAGTAPHPGPATGASPGPSGGSYAPGGASPGPQYNNSSVQSALRRAASSMAPPSQPYQSPSTPQGAQATASGGARTAAGFNVQRPATSAADSEAQQQNLASLIRQFRS